MAASLLGWVYTDGVALTSGEVGDRFTLNLMAAASQFGLRPLVGRCEDQLVSSVCVENCVRWAWKIESCTGKLTAAVSTRLPTISRQRNLRSTAANLSAPTGTSSPTRCSEYRHT